MALYIQLIAYAGLPFDRGFVLRYGLLHRQIIVEAQLEAGFGELAKVAP